ncbi:MAG TPA: cyclic lactone autoinducer peptide [Firmicutes bacterium]|nr:cyclic lactone autoinducer peptide [Bacillota bacterium]
MGKVLSRVYSFLAVYAKSITGFNANLACSYWVHQRKLPEKSKKLRRF